MSLTALLGLCGCAPLTGAISDRPAQHYVLSSEQPRNPAVATQGPVLLVSAPRARAGYDVRGIAYVRQPLKLDYYAHNEWADQPAGMIEPLLIDALEASGRFRAVLSAASGLSADLRLDTEITSLRHEFFAKPSQGRVTIYAQFIDVAKGEVRGTRRFDAVIPATTEDAYGGVTAMNRSLQQVLDDIVVFCGELSAKPDLSPRQKAIPRQRAGPTR